MIIKKELIDASIKAKNAAKEAKDKAIAESVLGLVEKMKELPPIIKDIMDTYFYVMKLDETLGTLMWRAMCSEDEEFGLDFCNAIREEAGDRCGVRPYYLRKGCFSHLYVTSSGVYFGERYDELYPIDELKGRLPEESYEPMLKAMCLMIEAVPAYRDKVASVLNELLEKDRDVKVQSNGLVMPSE